MSRVTFEAGRWPLVAGLPLPKASTAGDRVMTAGVWVFLLANGGDWEGNVRWKRGTDLRGGGEGETTGKKSVRLGIRSLTGRTRNGSNPLADSIRLGPTSTWTKDSIWAVQPTEVTPKRAHNHRTWKFSQASLPGFKRPMPSLCFAGILHRRAAPPHSVPPLLHLVWTRLVNLFVIWYEHPAGL
ncbi:hypothetical protein MUK42_36549 [Musa troglodytarum]|uniref:Uncharacterized protein n=1 Tax=Musa troglodytarum TaxID=320322 RepID=A0A9E7FMC5_9LILI|nr:hypothetical protein MUK42_36549 [Musa troglodytarum]